MHTEKWIVICKNQFLTKLLPFCSNHPQATKHNVTTNCNNNEVNNDNIVCNGDAILTLNQLMLQFMLFVNNWLFAKSIKLMIDSSKWGLEFFIVRTRFWMCVSCCTFLLHYRKTVHLKRDYVSNFSGHFTYPNNEIRK